ncbi:MAG: peptidoglycan-binding domain-containing protein [Bacteroidota bacterium]
MALYKLGSYGQEVHDIQQRLTELGLYRSPIDGKFGGATQSAVIIFQRKHGLTADGKVGAQTWGELFKENIPSPPIRQKSLDYRCLSLTASFETGAGIPDSFAGISGDFDGQGISFGALQWNIGQMSLQPLLKEILRRSPAAMHEAFGAELSVLEAVLHENQHDALAWARSRQHPQKHFIHEPWRGKFKALGHMPECHTVQVDFAHNRFLRAQQMAAAYGLHSERGIALMFDITVQNGSIGATTRSLILHDIQALPARLPEEEREVRKMRIIANRRAEAANPRWTEDVRRRKLCIANGSGTVHGISYNLWEQFGIGL